MPTYSIISVSYNDICLWSGRVVEPLVVEDVPSSVSEERMNQQYSSNAAIPIIEDAKSPTETSTETEKELATETQPTK